MKHRHLLLIAVAGATAIAACSSSGDDAAPVMTPVEAPATVASTAAPTTEPPPTTIDPEQARTIEQVNEYVAQAASFDQAGADAQFPQGLTFAAGGAPGYSRYVFREHSGGVVPTLVEGPISGTVRCQDESLPCSYLELKDLVSCQAGSPLNSVVVTAAQ